MEQSRSECPCQLCHDAYQLVYSDPPANLPNCHQCKKIVHLLKNNVLSANVNKDDEEHLTNPLWVRAPHCIFCRWKQSLLAWKASYYRERTLCLACQDLLNRTPKSDLAAGYDSGYDSV